MCQLIAILLYIIIPSGIRHTTFEALGAKYLDLKKIVKIRLILKTFLTAKYGLEAFLKIRFRQTGHRDKRQTASTVENSQLMQSSI